MKADDIKRIVDEYADQLASLPNVVGIGITSADDTDPSGEPAVAVYVRRKLPETQLEPAEIVPKKIEATVDGEHVEVPTRVIEVGEITLS
jgi:hypothetical protein